MKNKIIMIAVLVLSVVAAAGGTWWFTRPAPEPAAEGAEAESAKPISKPVYIGISPSFVVNLQGTRPMRFLMVEVELMSRSDDAKDTVKEYLPTVRHELNMLFSVQSADSIASLEDRQRLQQEALDTVNAVFQSEGLDTQVDGVYFTKFVVQ